MSTTEQKKFGRSKRQGLQLRFQAPLQNIIKRLLTQGFMEKERSKPKFIWISNDHRTIVKLYNSVVRGYLNYYSFVNNYGSLASRIMYILKGSCAKLLASKFKLKTSAAVYKKFGKHLTAKPTEIKTKPISFIHPSYKVTLSFMTKADPNIPGIYTRGISKATLEGLTCRICDSDYQVEMHHVRHMKDLNPKLSLIDKLMVKRNRKQIPLCRKCHMDRHYKNR